MRRLFGSVRARATWGATLVVAVALIAAGAAVLLSLRGNLEGRADSEADGVARQIASRVAAGTPYADLDLPDADDNPVQVVDEDGRVLAVSEGLPTVLVMRLPVQSGKGEPTRLGVPVTSVAGDERAGSAGAVAR